MKLHWFSPLLPDPTDIGHFSGRVLRKLVKKADVTVWSSTQNPQHPDLAGLDIRHFDPAKLDFRSLNQGHIIYNLGNNGPFHADILETMQMLPGTVILHEADLQGLLTYQWVVREHDGGRYLNYITKAYGEIGALFARSRLRGLPMDKFINDYPIAEPALQNATRVICHTAAAQSVAEKLGLPNLRINLPFPARDLATRPVRTGPIRLVQFGYLGPHRKLDAILDALSQIKTQIAFQFDIYGTLWDETGIRNQIHALGLQDRVRIAGFLDEAELDTAIAQADMVFNMRYPTVGEASGTQMRIWSNAAPSLVTEHGWFGSLPNAAVLKAAPGGEVARVRDLLLRLGQDRTCFDHMGMQGQRILLRDHAPADYVDALLEFVAA